MNQVEVCEVCQLKKQHKKPFSQQESWRTKRPMELVHFDRCGNMPIESLGGRLHKVWIKFLKENSQTFQVFKNFKVEVENYIGLHIKTLRIGHGGEFISNEVVYF